MALGGAIEYEYYYTPRELESAWVKSQKLLWHDFQWFCAALPLAYTPDVGQFHRWQYP